MPTLFALDGEDHLRWDDLSDRRKDLTTEQAQVVALAKAASALIYIGDALLSVAEVLRERKSD
jgi:hypothetical protein